MKSLSFIMLLAISATGLTMCGQDQTTIINEPKAAKSAFPVQAVRIAHGASFVAAGLKTFSSACDAHIAKKEIHNAYGEAVLAQICNQEKHPATIQHPGYSEINEHWSRELQTSKRMLRAFGNGDIDIMINNVNAATYRSSINNYSHLTLDNAYRATRKNLIKHGGILAAVIALAPLVNSYSNKN